MIKVLKFILYLCYFLGSQGKHVQPTIICGYFHDVLKLFKNK